MNRETKRLVAKQQAQAERDKVRAANITGRKGGGGDDGDGPRETRFRRWGRFLREVRLELKKVSWPRRGEVLTYTLVVITTVLLVTAFVFLLDFAFANTILEVFS